MLGLLASMQEIEPGSLMPILLLTVGIASGGSLRKRRRAQKSHRAWEVGLEKEKRVTNRLLLVLFGWWVGGGIL